MRKFLALGSCSVFATPAKPGQLNLERNLDFNLFLLPAALAGLRSPLGFDKHRGTVEGNAREDSEQQWSYSLG